MKNVLKLASFVSLLLMNIESQAKKIWAIFAPRFEPKSKSIGTLFANILLPGLGVCDDM